MNLAADPASLLIVAAVFVAGGLVKGVIGLGLPLVVLGLLATLYGVPTAMALMLAPSILTNLAQAASGGHGRAILRAHWPFLLCATIGVPPGALLLAHVDAGRVAGLLGLTLIVYAMISLAGWRPSPRLAARSWPGPLFGLANGVATGLTGVLSVPGVPWLQAAGLPRDALVQAMGMLFVLSSSALALSLRGLDLLPGGAILASLAALPPTLAGWWLGLRLRGTLSETAFRRVFLIALAAVGAHLVGLF